VARIEALRALADSRRLTAAKDALAADLRHLGAQTQTREQQHRALVESLKRTLASLQGQMATTSATIARLEADIDKHRIRAPIDGRIGDVVPLRAGEYVSAGQKLATVIPSGELIIVADFNPAAVLGRVRPGQTARLRLDGFPWAQYGSITATVTRVASEIRDNLVRVEFTPHSSFPPGIATQHGLPGAVEVSVEQVAPAVLVVRASGQMLSGAAATASP
jgi:membrane fusion protein, adhesin transport system